MSACCLLEGQRKASATAALVASETVRTKDTRRQSECVLDLKNHVLFKLHRAGPNTHKV